MNYQSPILNMILGFTKLPTYNLTVSVSDIGYAPSLTLQEGNKENFTLSVRNIQFLNQDVYFVKKEFHFLPFEIHHVWSG